MFVEEADLGEGVGAGEVVVFEVLRAGFEAAPARHALGDAVAHRLLLDGHAGSGAEVVGSVDGHPGLDGLEHVEHPRAIDPEVAHDGELGHGFEGDDIAVVGGVFINEARAGLADFAVDDHGAGAADFLEAAGVPHWGLSRLAFDGARIGADPLEATDDIGPNGNGHVEFLPPAGLAGSILTPDAEARLAGGVGGCGRAGGRGGGVSGGHDEPLRLENTPRFAEPHRGHRSLGLIVSLNA